MAVLYLDTSVVVKRYRTEEGTDFADILFEETVNGKNHSLLSSTLTVLEFMAAARRSLKGGLITQDLFESTVRLFAKESGHITFQPISEAILVRSIEVVMKHALRTADAIHVATAMEVQDMMDQLGDEVILVTNDDEMCHAGRAENFRVLTPRDIDDLRSLNK